MVQSVTTLSGAAFTIDPGVVVKFDSAASQLNVLGTLNANGTASQPIFFTSIKDDSVGGDTNNVGAVTNPAPGDWRSIFVNTNGVANFSHSIIRFGGRKIGAGISMSGGTLSLSNSHVTQNAGTNIFANSGTATITNSELDSSFRGISQGNGTLTVSGSSIHDNTQFGAFAGDGVPMQAQNNWWGSPSGPFHSTLNPTGLGNAVSDNVLFIPFLIADPVGPLP